jgi:hypothetical protein
LLHDLASKTNHKRVSSHSETPLMLGQATGNLDSFDSPRPRFEGSHHLPPYSILCNSPLRLHPNGIFSRGSQSGVPKLSRFALSGIWASITFFLRPLIKMRSETILYLPLRAFQRHVALHLQTSRSGRFPTFSGPESNCASLIPGFSFAHNLGYICPNGSCEDIFDIHTSRPFQ